MAHGGKRTNAGRKKKYGCESVTIRVPKDHVCAIMKFIWELLEKEKQK